MDFSKKKKWTCFEGGSSQEAADDSCSFPLARERPPPPSVAIKSQMETFYYNTLLIFKHKIKQKNKNKQLI